MCNKKGKCVNKEKSFIRPGEERNVLKTTLKIYAI